MATRSNNNPSPETGEKTEPTVERQELSRSAPRSATSELLLPRRDFGFGLQTSAFSTLQIPRNSRSELDLTPEMREELLASLPEDQKENFLREEKWLKLEQSLSYSEIKTLRGFELSSEELGQILQDIEQEQSPRIGYTRPPLGIEYSLHEASPENLSRIDKLTRSEVIATLGSLNDADLQELPPEISRRLMERISGDAEAILEVQQTRFHNENIAGLQSIRDGSRTNYLESRENFRNSLLPELLSSSTRAHRLESEGFDLRHDAASEALHQRQLVLQDSLANRRLAGILTRHADRLVEQDSSSERSKALRDSAASLYTSSSETLFHSELARFDSERGVSKIREAGSAFRTAEQRLGYLETGMRTYRNASVFVVAGGAATLAAPVVFTAAVGYTGSTAAGVFLTSTAGASIGAGTGLTYGSITSGVENSGHVLIGNRTLDDAVKNFKAQVRQDTHDGMLAGLGSGVGGSVGQLLKVSEATVPTWILLRNGAASSTAAAATNFSVSTTERIISARNEFQETYANSELSEEALAVKYAEHLKSRGLSWNQLSKEGGMNLAFAAFFGGSGAKFEQLRQGAVHSGVARNAAIEVGEWSLSTTLGFSRAYFETPEEQRTFENLLGRAIDEVTQNTYGAFQARAGVQNSPPAPETDVAMRTPTIGQDSPEVDTSTIKLQTRPEIDTSGGRLVPGGDVASILFPSEQARPDSTPDSSHSPNRIPAEMFETQSQAEPELVGVGPSDLNAALDGPSYQADMGGGSGGGAEEWKANDEFEASDVSGRSSGRRTQGHTPNEEPHSEVQRKFEQFSARPEKNTNEVRESVERATLYEELQAAASSDPAIKDLLSSGDPKVQSLKDAHTALTKVIRSITRGNKTPTTKRAADITRELRRSGTFDTLDKDSQNALSAAAAADDLVYENRRLRPGESRPALADSIRATLSSLSESGMEVDTMRRVIASHGEEGLEHLERLDAEAWRRYDAEFQETLPSELAEYTSESRALLRELSDGTLRNTALSQEETARFFPKRTPRVMVAEVGAVVDQIYRLQLGSHQVGYRGGDIEEARGWLSAGPEGDPRVLPDDSSYTRRTGKNPPAFDLDQTRSAGTTEVAIDYAKRYARGKDLGKDDHEIDVSSDEVVGAVIVFSAFGEPFEDSFHRHDPDWQGPGYNETVELTPGNRHPRAMIPIRADGSTPEGSFSMILSDEILALPQGTKDELFDAFEAQDKDRYEEILQQNLR